MRNMPKKHKFYKLMRDKQTNQIYWKEAEGELLVYNGEEYFLHREKEWKVTHGKTGMLVIKSRTKKGAKENFDYVMSRVNHEKQAERNKQIIEKYGLSPLYTDERERVS